MMKGTLHETENGWVVEYKKSIKLDDDEAQYEGRRYVFYKEHLPLHPEYEKYYFLDWDAEGAEVEFEIEAFWETGLEQVINVAKLIKPNNSSKIVELQDGVNLEEISKDQIEKERNPAYKYFDPLQQVADEIDANIVKMMIKASRETMINYTKWLAQEEWMSIWVEDKWMWECQKENNKYLDSTNSYGYVTEEELYDLYLKNL